MIIAIDGPAGVGKSTIAKMIASKANLFYLNSGNFYRGVTLSVLENSIDPENSNLVIEESKKLSFSIQNDRLYMDEKDVEDLLHSDRVDQWVAQHSAIPEVRITINEHLRKVTRGMNIIAEGRDITTVVFPQADIKVFLDASPEIRAERRFKQGVSSLTMDEILQGILKRDKIDKNKPVGSLKIADDALYLDTSHLTIDQVCEKVVNKIMEINQD
jgi:cytidylate kinase